MIRSRAAPGRQGLYCSDSVVAITRSPSVSPNLRPLLRLFLHRLNMPATSCRRAAAGEAALIDPGGAGFLARRDTSLPCNSRAGWGNLAGFGLWRLGPRRPGSAAEPASPGRVGGRGWPRSDAGGERGRSGLRAMRRRRPGASGSHRNGDLSSSATARRRPAAVGPRSHYVSRSGSGRGGASLFRCRTPSYRPLGKPAVK